MEIGSSNDSAAVVASPRPQTGRQEPPTAPAQEREAEVQISQEARDLRAERARAEAEAAAESRREAREDSLTDEDERAAAEKGAIQPGVIAVRLGVGPPPLEQQQERAGAEDIVRQGLKERSLIPQIDELLDDGEKDEREVAAAPLRGARDHEQRTRIPGQDKAKQPGPEEREFTPTPSTAEALASRDAGTRDRAVAEALQQVERRSVDRSDEPEDLDRATAVAPQVGLATGGEETRRAEILGADRQDDSSESQAREVLTLGGTVEANAADQLVTRFLGSGEREEPGPEPRAREELGERASEPEPHTPE